MEIATENWAWTVCERFEFSTKLSIGFSVVNTVSKFDTSYLKRLRSSDLKNRWCIRTTGLSTLGLNGGWIFFSKSFLKLICFPKNGCFLISSAPLTPSRCRGSRVSRAVRMLRASASISGPNTSGSFKILSYILSVTSIESARSVKLSVYLEAGMDVPW